jgi:rRNA processing protein Krr1/Pno1
MLTLCRNIASARKESHRGYVVRLLEKQAELEKKVDECTLAIETSKMDEDNPPAISSTFAQVICLITVRSRARTQSVHLVRYRCYLDVLSRKIHDDLRSLDLAIWHGFTRR